MTIREETSKNIGYFKRISNYLVFIYLDFDLIFFTFDEEVFHEENSGDRCKESRKERLYNQMKIETSHGRVEILLTRFQKP